ncbi:glycosyltransferase [Enterococcus faecium]|uniref:glycosyltransferase n=1 Tax=Enterococcus faecium TaxID=1352 RepID=UPI000DF3C876|nr:glycosyltransferase [Enterococcus faecium]RCT66023.1 glycosyltransferase [Enterococcus faecium]
MNVLFITTQFPYPLDNGGKIGAYNGISVLSRDYDVTVLSFTEEPQYVEEGVSFFREKFNSVKFENPVIHDVHIRNNPMKLVEALAIGYCLRQPYIVSKFYDSKMLQLIDENFSNNAYWDIIFIDYLNMQSYGQYIREKYKTQFGKYILKDHNIEYDLVLQEAESSRGLKKKLLQLEYKRTRKYEEAAVNRADYCFSVCDANTEVLKKINDNSYTMLPTYEMLTGVKKNIEKNTILYLGNLSWKSNMQGLVWFLESIYPNIQQRIPDVKITIVGSGPVGTDFSKYSGVDYRGYVKDISHIYDDQAVLIVPLLEGSGIRIKILEAFNNEIAVVSTLVGCDTIGAKDGSELFIADNEKDFATAVVRLLEDMNLNEKVRKNAKLFLKEKYSLTARQDEFSAIINS